MTHRQLSAIASAVLLVFPAAAQDDPVNLIHQRHTHQHNGPHPTVVDDSRFTTDRQSPVVLPLPEEKDAFTFVVFGDRTGGPDEGVNVLADAVHDTNLLEPDLVMTVGDLIDGYNQTPEWMQQMREYKGIMNELLCPWFPVAGNHDTYWRGPEGAKPDGEHDANYEMHFGPLWYAFEHKNCWFIALYSDEGNPETGEKNFSKPESQSMSPEQFAWLDATLAKAKDADHVFIFLHHPRWLKGGYGDDWERVHARLVEAGNVSAVFAGHIHRMRHDGPFNGIEYVTLATVGGGQSGLSADAGYLHHFNVVTVRKEQIAMASLPVGGVQDVRAITGELSDEVGRLARDGVVIQSQLGMTSEGRVEGGFAVTLRNPTSKPVEATLTPESEDSRWWFTPDHVHTTIPAHSEEAVRVWVTRDGGGSLDRSYRVPQVAVDYEYLAGDFRYAVPTKAAEVPVSVELAAPPRPETERALSTGADGASVAVVASESIKLPQAPFTLECWMQARSFGHRVGLVAKTENSEYGFFVNRGQPTFSVHLDGRYAEAGAGDLVLEPGTWYHIAGVYDGQQVRLFVDGKLVGSVTRSGERTLNRLPLVIGGDVASSGAPTSAFDGLLDEVRLSTGVAYTEDFMPQRRLSTDESVLVHLHMDGAQGPYLYDASEFGAHATMKAKAELVEP